MMSSVNFSTKMLALKANEHISLPITMALDEPLELLGFMRVLISSNCIVLGPIYTLLFGLTFVLKNERASASVLKTFLSIKQMSN